jgi:hypothetical protein
LIGVLLVGLAVQRYQKCQSEGGQYCKIVGPKPRGIIKAIKGSDNPI